MKTKTILVALALITTSGCVSVSRINEGFRRIDRMWQLEYQKTEDEYRYRVVEADYATTFEAVKKTFLDFGMPIQKASISEGVISAENEAPIPLTQEEWEKVVKVEKSRVKKVGGWMFTLSKNPKKYIVLVKAGLMPANDKTFVVLDYELDCPEYRRQGFEPSKHAPPLAVEIASDKFWKQLTLRLQEVDAPKPRRVQINEKLT